MTEEFELWMCWSNFYKLAVCQTFCLRSFCNSNKIT